MYDLLVKNGKLVTPDRIYEADVAIKDGKYAAIVAKGTEVEAEKSLMPLETMYSRVSSTATHI